jgi:hypothetical protein
LNYIENSSLHLHLLKVIHKKGFAADELKDRALQLEKVTLLILQFNHFTALLMGLRI